MKATWWLGRVSGVRIGLHWSAVLLIVLVADVLAVGALPDWAPGHGAGAYWTAGLIGAVLLAGAVLAHELAHVRVAQLAAIPVSSVTLWMLGGVSRLAADPVDAETELRVAIAGPLCSAVISVGLGTCAVVASAAGAGALAVGTLSWSAGANAILALFNLLPGNPLDGGHVLHALLWRRSGDRTTATIAAGRMGRSIGAGLVGLGVFEMVRTTSTDGLWLVLIGWFMGSSAASESRARLALAGLGDLRVGAVMTDHPVTVATWWTLDDVLEHAERAGSFASYPVIDVDGRPAGLLRLAALAAVPVNRRGSLTVAHIFLPVSACTVVDAADRLSDILPRLGRLRADDLLLVAGYTRLVGVLSLRDLSRLMQGATLLGDRAGVLKTSD